MRTMNVLLLLAGWACTSPSEATPPLDPPAPPPVPSEEPLEPASASHDAELTALAATSDWEGLVQATEGRSGLPRSWALVQLDRPEEAMIVDFSELPPSHAAWLEGRIKLANSDTEAGLDALAQVAATSPLYRDALARRAATLPRAEAEPLLRELVAEPDPAPGNAPALAALGDPSSLWRIWANYPGSPEDVATGLSPADASWQDVTRRAYALMGQSDWDGAIALLEPRAAEVPATSDPDACRFRYTLGRAHYKKNNRDPASAALDRAAELCLQDPDLGPQIGYLAATHAGRRGRHQTSARHWQALTKALPEHRFADDGLVNAGAELFESGDVAGARSLWNQAFEAYPDGDMVPEALFRVAWSHYLAGEPDEAVQAATKLGNMDPTLDRFHVPAGMYWAGRWSLYPDVDHPTRADPAGRGTALTWWTRCVESQPWSYYAVLSQGRLLELDPTSSRQLAPRETTTISDVWVLRRELVEGPIPQLLALGLVDEAEAEWARLSDPTEQEIGWFYASRIALGDWLDAHRELRGWLRTNMPSEPGPEARQLLSLAYPDRWLTEVEAASAGYRFPPRYFHGLVRVESNFDDQAISWAGARGLSQVMPATGRNVGIWLGLQVDKEDLLIPETNLAVGAKYMDFLHGKFQDSPYLSAAGYNAGENRVDQWLGEWGNLPTDEFVERIPFDETRGYVKRVVGTWQTYNYLRGVGPSVVELDRYNHQALAQPPG